MSRDPNWNGCTLFFQRRFLHWNLTQYDLTRRFLTKWGCRRYAIRRRYKAEFIR